MEKPSMEITITIPTGDLRHASAEKLALYWHLAQANPAPLADRAAGELTMRIGWEIIRRWLGQVEPPLYHHQQHHYWWTNLTKFAQFVNGEWQAKPGDSSICSEHRVPLDGGRCRLCERVQVRRTHVRRWQGDGTWSCAVCTEQQGVPILWPCLVLRAVDVAEGAPSADSGLMSTRSPSGDIEEQVDLSAAPADVTTEPPGVAP